MEEGKGGWRPAKSDGGKGLVKKAGTLGLEEVNDNMAK